MRNDYLKDIRNVELTPEEIKQALARPSDFGLSSEAEHAEEFFHTWALGPVIQTRDSSLCEKANAQALKTYLESIPSLRRFWAITSCNHWAVGWVDHLSYQVVTKTGKPTKIALVLKAWFDSLRNYPIADESLLSRLESEAEQEAWDSLGEKDFARALDDVFSVLDPGHDHDVAKLGSLWDLWCDGCETYQVEGGSGCSHSDEGVSFGVTEWRRDALDARYVDAKSWRDERPLRARLIELAVACREE